MKKPIVIIACALATVVALLGPWPLPVWFAIQTDVATDGSGSAEFYWKPAGALGLITQDNPWVYVEIRESGPRARTRIERIWADSPCDGVDRLRASVPWPVRACESS